MQWLRPRNRRKFNFVCKDAAQTLNIKLTKWRIHGNFSKIWMSSGVIKHSANTIQNVIFDSLNFDTNDRSLPGKNSAVSTSTHLYSDWCDFCGNETNAVIHHFPAFLSRVNQCQLTKHILSSNFPSLAVWTNSQKYEKKSFATKIKTAWNNGHCW